MAERAIELRREKLAKANAGETRQFEYRFEVDRSASEVAAQFANLAIGERSNEVVRVAGRVMLIRCHGGLTFDVIQDRTGSLQLFADRAAMGVQEYGELANIDRGDWLGVVGHVMRTDKGELSVTVDEFHLLGKALRPPPDKDKALTDVEVRYRQRYVDLMTNERTREIFEVRRKTVQAIRRHLEDHGFWEVEGPMLQNIQGGATARPFITHHNALDIDMYLRIALELHLKRLVVGGMERVFELGRVFRNEGIDVRHNPEFTMLEAYQAYADYNDMMDLVEGMIGAAVGSALDGKFVVKVGDQEVDMAPPYPRVTLSDLIEQRLGVKMDPTMPVAEARRILDSMGLEWEESWGSGKLMKQVVDEKIQHEIVDPVFCIDYPKEVSPLARVHRSRPGYVERFELIVAGFELCNAYSEQNDADEQLVAFEAEARAKAEGDPEAGDMDLDYVRALEYGMPCTGGLGIGIDRLVMLLSGARNIREVVLFPTMRPEHGQPSPSGPKGLGRLEPKPAPEAKQSLSPVQAVVREPINGEALNAERHRLRWLGSFAGLGGMIMLLTMVPALHSRLEPFGDPIGPVWFRVAGHLVTMLLGLGLLFIAGQVARGKHRAWQLAVGIFGFGIITNILKGPHPISAAYCLVMFIALIVNRAHFRGRSDPPSLFRLLRLAPIYVAAVFAFGITSLALERKHIEGNVTLGNDFLTTVQGLVGVSGPYHYEHHFFRTFFPTALLLLGIAGLIGAAYLFFRPLAKRSPHTEDDWSHARRLVKTYGDDTLAYFALRDDKSFFFSSDGEAFIAYTYMGGYALASGDPIGASSSVDLALDEFMLFCRQRAWRVAFLAARTEEMPKYAARGLRSFYLGDEAIIHCDSFTLDGGNMKSVRSAVRRVAKNYRFQIFRESEASPALVESLNAISREWRGKAPERGFTMALSQDIEGDGNNPEFLLCIALDEDGQPGGFLRIVPAYGDDFGYTLDLMRHRPTAPNGMTEFLISQTALRLQAEGIVRLSMNFAMWGKFYDEGTHFSFSQRMAKHAIDMMNPFFQIKSLHDFNEKFDPEWLSRMLVYQEPTDLPRVALLYAGAEGFLSLPGVGELFVPKAVGGASADQAA